MKVNLFNNLALRYKIKLITFNNIRDIGTKYIGLAVSHLIKLKKLTLNIEKYFFISIKWKILELNN